MKLIINRKFKNCLITGITGSGGSYLAEHILKKNDNTKVTGTYRSKGFKNFLLKKYGNKIKFFKVDLNNFQNVKKVIKLIKPDLIFHLASNPNVRESFDNPLKIIKKNNQITLNILEALRQLKSKAVIQICSSSEVYGSVSKKNIPIKESQKMMPINPYAVSKAFQDLLSQVYHKVYKLNIIITRMFTYTNPRRNNLFQSAFARQIINLKKNKKKFIYHGNLNSIRSILDVDDAMEAYWICAVRGKIGEVYNISGSKTMSVKNYLKNLIKFSGVKVKTIKQKKLLRPTDIDIQVPSTKKFKLDTGWREKVSLNESLKKLLISTEEILNEKI